MVFSLGDEVAEAGSTIVLFWKRAWELAEEQPVAAVLSATLDVVASALPAVLFWNGAFEARDKNSVAAVPAVFTKPVAAVFKGTLEVVDAVVLFWKSASGAIEEEAAIATLFKEPM
jgi:hypothetical protein